MGHDITIKIGGRDYVLVPKTEDEEEAIRKAASGINKMIETYQAKFPKKNMDDILSFVALNLGISYVKLQKKTEDIEKEWKRLNSDLEGYLAGIE